MRIGYIEIVWIPDEGEDQTARTKRVQYRAAGIQQTYTFEGEIQPVDLEWLYWLAESVEIYERESHKPKGVPEADSDEADEADSDETEH